MCLVTLGDACGHGRDDNLMLVYGASARYERNWRFVERDSESLSSQGRLRAVALLVFLPVHRPARCGRAHTQFFEFRGGEIKHWHLHHAGSVIKCWSA